MSTHRHVHVHIRPAPDETYPDMLERAKDRAASIIGRGVKYMRIRRVHVRAGEYRVTVASVSRAPKEKI